MAAVRTEDGDLYGQPAYRIKLQGSGCHPSCAGSLAATCSTRHSGHSRSWARPSGRPCYADTFTRKRCAGRSRRGLNVIESWNSANGFIFFGKGQEISTNRQADQEAAMLSLHLL